MEKSKNVERAEPDKYLEYYKTALATIEYLDSGKYMAN
jgi:hypothetical protein